MRRKQNLHQSILLSLIMANLGSTSKWSGNYNNIADSITSYANVVRGTDENCQNIVSVANTTAATYYRCTRIGADLNASISFDKTLDVPASSDATAVGTKIGRKIKLASLIGNSLGWSDAPKAGTVIRSIMDIAGQYLVDQYANIMKGSWEY